MKKVKAKIGEDGKFLNKEELIKAEEERLTEVYKDIEEKRKKVTSSLIPRAAYLIIQTQELEHIVNVKGYTEEYQNGATQRGMKKTCEVEILNNAQKNLMNIIKQLTDQLPKQDAKQTVLSDDFDDFLSSRCK